MKISFFLTPQAQSVQPKIGNWPNIKELCKIQNFAKSSEWSFKKFYGRVKTWTIEWSLTQKITIWKSFEPTIVPEKWCSELCALGVKHLYIESLIYFSLLSYNKVFNMKNKYAMTNESYGLWIMAVLRTKQDVIKFALLYLPIGDVVKRQVYEFFRKY